jgi:hypothetical protein
MSVCVPKHIICETYIPDFTPGNTPCTLQVFNELKSRLLIHGIFFRSLEVGTHQNNITVAATWQYEQTPGVWVETAIQEEVERVEVIVSDVTITETYHIPQSGEIDTGTQEWEWDAGIISALNSAVNSSSVLIEVNPTEDAQQPWPEDPPPTEPTDHIEPFIATNLSGGDGGPNDPTTHSPTIRTGPAMSMVYIADSERHTSDGTTEIINETRYWNGDVWLAHDPNNPDCYDPDNLPPGLCD